MIKLRCEDFESTTSIGTQYNPPVENIYENLEALGMLFTVAANDIHTIHVNACGKDFQTLHLEANDLYQTLDGYMDTVFEMCCEDGHYIHSINDAKELLSDKYPEFTVSECPFELIEGVQTIINILNFVIGSIKETYDVLPSDIQSTMDEWLRYLNSKMNYFLGRILQGAKAIAPTNESMMNRSTRRNRRKFVCEHLDKLKLGQSYTLFCQVEDHIEDYNCDTVDLKKGDYIIRDFQFGHLPNGGNKGYIPYEVIDIEYDRDDHTGGYWDARKRLHLFDGYEDFYIECYNERFNGMFHKLKKSSIEK